MLQPNSLSHPVQQEDELCDLPFSNRFTTDKNGDGKRKRKKVNPSIIQEFISVFCSCLSLISSCCSLRIKFCDSSSGRVFTTKPTKIKIFFPSFAMFLRAMTKPKDKGTGNYFLTGFLSGLKRWLSNSL